MAIKIDQKDNFANNFGEVLRSSAIFYYRKDDEIETTISFLNYWQLKRDLRVGILASVRKKDGTLVRRERLTFTQGQVLNYSPFQKSDGFEGSVEIEIVCAENMFIPYPAIMVIYRSAKGISFVHSYGRTYSPHEIEEKRTITEGEEGCWTLLDSDRVQSFAIFHNGNQKCAKQSVRLRVLNHRKETREAQFELADLNPYETVRIEPDRHIADLTKFLDGKPGNATLSFHLKNSFTRMLVGNRSKDGQDLQVTHSNFNYSVHQTDHLQSADPRAYLITPVMKGCRSEMIVYPDCDRGTYHISAPGGSKVDFHDGEIRALPYDSSKAKTFVFEKEGGALPSRIVTALRVSQNADRLPAECSLGVVHKKRPGKRMWWGLCATQEGLRSRISLTEIDPVYGSSLQNDAISVRIYSQFSNQFLETKIEGAELLRRSPFVDELFPEAAEFFRGGFGWYTLYSEYPGYFIFSTLENKNGSFAIEHGF